MEDFFTCPAKLKKLDRCIGGVFIEFLDVTEEWKYDTNEVNKVDESVEDELKKTEQWLWNLK